MAQSIFHETVATAISEQPWFVRRKDTLTALAGLLLQVANLNILQVTDTPTWVSILIAFIIGAAQIIIHAGTRGAITPSMGERLLQASHHTQPAPEYTTAITGLPVYDTPSTGEHHADL